MNARILLFIAVVLMPGVGLGVGTQQSAQQFELQINGQTNLVTEGKATRLVIAGRETTVLLKRAEPNVLSFDSYSFRFPRSYSKVGGKSSDASDSASWMLKGRSSQITIHRKDKKTTLEFLADHMAEFYNGLDAAEDVRREATSLRAAGKSLTGVRFVMNSRGEGINYQDYFQLPVASPMYNYFLVIHSKPGAREVDEAKLLLGRTLR